MQKSINSLRLTMAAVAMMLSAGMPLLAQAPGQTAGQATGTGPVPALYESFDTGKEPGRFGNAAASYKREARDVVDLSRGTMSFFIKSDRALEPNNWNRIAGVNGTRSGSYWGMLMDFNIKFGDMMFNLYDAGRYSPPLRFESPIGRWQPGQWVHIAAVWDQSQGVTLYEDGKRVASNWGEHSWPWNLMPSEIFFNAPVDELYVFHDALTDAQVAELAAGKKPTGPALATKPDNVQFNQARMGWTGEGMAQLPTVSPDKPLAITYARMEKAVAARRPIATPFDGLPGSTWPDIKYGASTRGEKVDLTLQPGSTFDRMRLFIQRNFEGALVKPTADGKTEQVLTIQSPDAVIWHRPLGKPMSDRELTITRKRGNIGQIDFYRAENIAPSAISKEQRVYGFEKTDALPKDDTGLTLLASTSAPSRRPLLGRLESIPAWTLSTESFAGFEATTTPMEKAHAFDGVVVKLVVEGITKPTPVQVIVKEPVQGVRSWLSAEFVLEPKGPGRQTYTVQIKGRPVINTPAFERRPYIGRGRYDTKTDKIDGELFGIKVTAGAPVTWAMGDGGCTFGFTLTDMKTALGPATDDQVEFMREAYAEHMEGHQFSHPSLAVPLRWLTMFAPQRMETRQMYERVGSPLYFEGINVPKLVYEKPVNNTGAPDWAFWQMKVMDEHRKILDFYIDEKQIHTGEYGGIWNDDTDHVEQWIGLALCMDESGKIKNSLRKFWDGLWTHQLEQGVGKYVQDACHYYEEGMGSIAMRLLVDYGDPVAHSRAMITCSHYDKWTRTEEDGGIGLVSEFIGLNENWTMGKRFAATAGRRGHNRDVIVPAAYLVWYNHEPNMAKLIKGWFKSATPGMNSGLIAFANDQLSDPEIVRQNYTKRLLESAVSNGGDAMLINEVIDAIGLSDEARAKLAKPYQPVETVIHYISYTSTEMHWFQFVTSGDIRFLVDSYIKTCEWFYSHDWLNSRAEPSMDRNPLPRTALVRARTGGLASNRGASRIMWPSYGISYEKGADSVAALITKNTSTGLTGRYYAFADKPLQLDMKVWRLDPGTYKVTLSKDANDDGKPEEVISTQTLQLDRGAPLSITLPARQACVMEITPIKTSPPNYDLPDPAISAGTVELIYDDHLVVRVFNNGRKPVENLLVRVRDAKSGKVIGRGEQVIPLIPAPTDLKPVHRAVEFLNISPNAQGVIVEIDPDNKSIDLNRHNNRVELSF